MELKQPVLLVKDDKLDVLLVRRAFDKLAVQNPLVHCADGKEAFRYLEDKSNEKPAFILLDLNMPEMDGIEFLKTIKANNNLKQIPVIILSTSTNQQDINNCFSLGAAGYMVKVIENDKFIETIRVIIQYWMTSKLSD